MTDGLTREQVLAMEPGRELDALVAEKLMGWKIRRTTVLAYGSNPLATFRTLYTVTDGRGIDWSPTYDLDGVGLPRYCTDISAAFEVLDHLIKQGAEVNVGFYKEWDCDIDYPIGCNWRATGKTAAEAISKAALLAVMGE